MRFTALSLLALVLLATPAAAENPDGPRGLLTVDGAFAPIIGHGEESTGFTVSSGTVGGSDLRVSVLAPVTNWLTVGVETRRWAFSQEFTLQSGRAISDYWQLYLGVRARVHIALTDHAKKSLRAGIDAQRPES